VFFILRPSLYLTPQGARQRCWPSGTPLSSTAVPK